MSKGNPLCIHDMFNMLMHDHLDELARSNQEIQQQIIEKRQWVIALQALIKKIHRSISNNQNWHDLFCMIQLMVTVFASLSVTWSAVANLAFFGLSGFFYITCVAAIMSMSAFTCLLAAVQYVKFGMDGSRFLRYQKLRSIEIKLFRSPDMPKPEGGKTKALVEYMNYYAIEKSVFRMINKVWSNNTSIHSDILNANWIPIELKARMALVMRAKQASDPLNNQRRICRLIRDEYSRIYDKINEEVASHSMSEKCYISQIYANAKYDRLNEPSLTVASIEDAQDIEQWMVKLLVAHIMHRFAFFARKHGEEQDKMLSKEGNGYWGKLSAQQKKHQMIKAFRWSIKQHLKRQNKKVSNINVGHFFMYLLKTCFIISVAVLPSGFGLLASSPVASIINFIGVSWSCQLIAWFWFSGVVDYMTTSRKDAEKTWVKICEFVNKNFIQKESKNPQIEQHTWSFSLDMFFRGFVAFSMACARALFTYNSIAKLVRNPATIGGRLLFYRLFKLLMPWLEPLFLPFCASLSFVDGLLHFAQITKYYSLRHLPRPMRGVIKDERLGSWSGIKQRVNYFLIHNFDFSKRPVPKLLKLAGSIVAVLQTMVLYVSAQQVLGTWLALLLMPGAALVLNASNRSAVELGTDLWHQYVNSEYFDINLKNKYQSWFQVKRKSERNPSSNNRSASDKPMQTAGKRQPVIILSGKADEPVKATIGERRSQIPLQVIVNENNVDEQRVSGISIQTNQENGAGPTSQGVFSHDRTREESTSTLTSNGADSSETLVEMGQDEFPVPNPHTPKNRKIDREGGMGTPATDTESHASMASPRSIPGTPKWNQFLNMLKEIRRSVTPDNYQLLKELISEEETGSELMAFMNQDHQESTANLCAQALQNQTTGSIEIGGDSVADEHGQGTLSADSQVASSSILSRHDATEKPLLIAGLFGRKGIKNKQASNGQLPDPFPEFPKDPKHLDLTSQQKKQ